jgi:hypothetical protein
LPRPPEPPERTRLSLLNHALDDLFRSPRRTEQVDNALTRARRRHLAEKTARIQAVLRSEQMGQPEVLTAVYAATTHAPSRCCELSMSRSKSCKGH